MMRVPLPNAYAEDGAPALSVALITNPYITDKDIARGREERGKEDGEEVEGIGKNSGKGKSLIP